MKIKTRKPEVSSYNKIIKETDCGESFDVRRSSLLVRGGTTTVEKVCTVFNLLISTYLSIGSTETKYIKRNTKTQGFFFIKFDFCIPTLK